MATGWEQYVDASVKLGFKQVCIINKANDSTIAKSENADVSATFAKSWNKVIKGEMFLSYWFRNNRIVDENKSDCLPNDVTNLCLQYAYSVNEFGELKKPWNKDQNSKLCSSIHMFGTKYLVVHRDENKGDWIVGRYNDDCVVALELKTIWMVLGAPVKPNPGGFSKEDQAKYPTIKSIQNQFADFMKNIGFALQEAGV